MSVFNDDPTKGDVKDSDQSKDTVNQDGFLKKVVEAKGDHWTDPETLAKGYLHAQQRIKELEEFENKSKEQDYAKQLLERLQSQAPAASGKAEDTQTQGKEDPGNTTQKSEDLESLIEQTLTRREAENTVKQNLTAADRQLTEAFGTEAKTVVATKAKELGMSMKDLEEIAGKSPTAFMALIGKAPQKETNQTAQSSVNTAGFNSNPNDRNHAYYQKLRRENRSVYHTPEIQMQMFNDRVRLGDKFYN